MRSIRENERILDRRSRTQFSGEWLIFLFRVRQHDCRTPKAQLFSSVLYEVRVVWHLLIQRRVCLRRRSKGGAYDKYLHGDQLHIDNGFSH
jgi:hypothetical protein